MQAHSSPPEEHATDAFRAPLFTELLAEGGVENRRVVLDLGRLAAGTLAVLENTRTCLLVSDAADVIAELSRNESSADEAERVLRGSLPGEGREPVDLILAWDLLNYASPAVLEALGRVLVSISRPGAWLHALIHNGAARMPERPGVVAPIGGDEMVYRPRGDNVLPAPRYTPWDLEKHGRSFKVDRSRMLRNRMQEYVLAVHPDASGPREIPALYRSQETE